MTVTEEYGVLVGCTLVDASKWSATVLMVNPSSEVVGFPSFTCVGNLVPVSAVSTAHLELESPGMNRYLPDHLEDIVGEEGRMTLRNILHQYAHVFPSPGEPVTDYISTA